MAFPAIPASTALASSGDSAATHAYLLADYRLVHVGTSKMPRIERTLHQLLASVRSDCPRAAAGSPQDPQSTQLSNEVIGALVIGVVALDRPAGRQFVASVAHLHWSDRAVNSEVGTYVAHVRVLLSLPQPDLCRDVRAWAASRFTALPPGNTSFAPPFMAAWVGLGDLPGGLRRLSSPADLPLLRRTAALEWRFENLEAKEVETWVQIMDALELWP